MMDGDVHDAIVDENNIPLELGRIVACSARRGTIKQYPRTVMRSS